MSAQRSTCRAAAGRLAVAALAATALLAGPATAAFAAPAGPAQESVHAEHGQSADNAKKSPAVGGPVVQPRADLAPGGLQAHRVSSAPGRSVYETFGGDNVTVSTSESGPEALIRTNNGGWVGTLTAARKGPVSSPYSGWIYVLVDGSRPYLDMYFEKQTGRIDFPVAAKPKSPATAPPQGSAPQPGATAAPFGADSGGSAGGAGRPPAENPASRGHRPDGDAAGPPGSGAAGTADRSPGEGAVPPAHGTPAADEQTRIEPQGAVTAGGAPERSAGHTNLVLYAGGALIAATAVAGVGLSVTRRKGEKHG
ncbi:hypothetical protein [Yinghuangia soli]|uniref:SH3 domain-containing protein n=1 Tax=Yinghuangia soli TaxID=2908204 RepID=A0AA41U2W5_9ACTN|nr:hypothetical protein [Yinghuangia soli]MCF2529097.1 hypothetical protein [Yinghuangia soli]